MRTAPLLPRRALLALNTLWLTCAPLPALAIYMDDTVKFIILWVILSVVIGLFGAQLLAISVALIVMLWRGHRDHARLRRVSAWFFSADLVFAAGALLVSLTLFDGGRDAWKPELVAIVFTALGVLGWWSRQRAPRRERPDRRGAA